MLVIDVCGPKYARRYFLKDREGNFWGEKGWTTNPREATLFADGNEVTKKMHDLMMSQVPGVVHRFTAPVAIEVKSPEPADQNALQEWLDKAVQVFMNAKHGTGPGQSMVMLCIDWNELNKEREGNEPNT
jgi:hypothetical protein